MWIDTVRAERARSDLAKGIIPAASSLYWLVWLERHDAEEALDGKQDLANELKETLSNARVRLQDAESTEFSYMDDSMRALSSYLNDHVEDTEELSELRDALEGAIADVMELRGQVEDMLAYKES